MDNLEGSMLSEVSQRKTNTVCFTYMWNFKNKQTNAYNNPKQTNRYRE